MRHIFGTLLRQADTPTISPALRRAHKMMNMGEYARAAVMFEQLAHTTEYP